MRRYSCNKGELTLIHIRTSGTRAQISHKYQKTTRCSQCKIMKVKYVTLCVIYLNNKTEYQTKGK